jgi:hypothetical protein
MSTSTPDWPSPSMPNYRKLAGEMGGLIESVRNLTGRVGELERPVAGLRTNDPRHEAATRKPRDLAHSEPQRWRRIRLGPSPREGVEV